MSQPIQSCFERYEKKYFLTPAGQKALLQAIAPYIKMDFYGKYTIPSATFIMIPRTGS